MTKKEVMFKIKQEKEKLLETYEKELKFYKKVNFLDQVIKYESLINQLKDLISILCVIYNEVEE